MGGYVPEGEGTEGSKILFFRGKQGFSPGLSRDYSGLLAAHFFYLFSSPRPDRHFRAKRTLKGPKWSPEIPKSAKSLAKVGSKSKPRNQARKKELQSVRIVLSSGSWLHFRGSLGIPKNMQNGPQMEPKIIK